MIDDGRDALQQRIVPELEELWPLVKKLDAVRQHILQSTWRSAWESKGCSQCKGSWQQSSSTSGAPQRKRC